MLTFTKVSPTSKEWDLFIDLSVEYLIVNWPQVLEGDTPSTFKNRYRQETYNRFQIGGRGLFLALVDDQPAGIINAFIEKDVLNIAEFYLIEEKRRQSYGGQMKAFTEDWGRREGASQLMVEVDKDFTSANLFWSSFSDLDLDVL